MKTRYDSIAVNDDTKENIKEFKEYCEIVAQLIDISEMEPRLKAIALTHLEACAMYGTKALAQYSKEGK